MATLTASGVNFSDGTTINGTTFNTIGSYAMCYVTSSSNNISQGSTWSAGTGVNRIQGYNMDNGASNILSGTWRYMGNLGGYNGCTYVGRAIAVRIA